MLVLPFILVYNYFQEIIKANGGYVYDKFNYVFT